MNLKMTSTKTKAECTTKPIPRAQLAGEKGRTLQDKLPLASSTRSRALNRSLSSKGRGLVNRVGVIVPNLVQCQLVASLVVDPEPQYTGKVQ